MSPDGALKLVVDREEGDVTIGFDGFGWHTHGDLLASRYQLEGISGLTADQAARKFVDSILESRRVIVVLRVADEVRDVSVTDDVERELRYQQPDQQLVFRYWNGATATGAHC